MKLGTLVEVTWCDVWSDNDSMHPSEFKDEQLAITVGWVVRDTDKIISIASEKFPGESSVCGVTHIYKPLVKKVRRLDTDR